MSFIDFDALAQLAERNKNNQLGPYLQEIVRSGTAAP
jgi:hypothetical protein